uniref:U-box domain-containing protein n=1 Tax=Nelumbo nucifera TaxID=4432 RepID=A0A822YCT2_NELNU|nr:TPA_asm: hypothetical protein HUJ06_030567 [Nelumbo nucifera]
MKDPVIVASGQTFKRNYVHACKKLGFTLILSEGSKPILFTIIPNITFKSTILNWCNNSGVERPKSMEYASTKKHVCALMMSLEEKSQGEHNKKEEEDEKDAKLGAFEKELLEGVVEKPPIKFSHTKTKVN